MDGTAIEERFSRLEQENAELKREIQLLRGVPEAKQDAREGELLPRRDLLKGAAYALGAVSLSLMGTRPAKAGIGYLELGQLNPTGASSTTLTSAGFGWTLGIQNSTQGQFDDPQLGQALYVTSNAGHGINVAVSSDFSTGDGVHVAVDGSGHGVQVVKPSFAEFGHAVLAYQKHPTSFYAAIAGVTSGAGPGLQGRGEGSGNGVWGQIADATKAQSAILGTTEGSGAAIEGNSIKGRGGVFKGKKAAVRLVASSASTKPSTGTRGDLFVDSTGRLWYCKTTGSSAGWQQLA